MSAFRRMIIGAAAAVATLSVSAFMPIPAQAQEKILLKFATISAPNNWETRMMHVFAEYVNQAAPGQFDIQVFDSGTLLKQGGQVQALERGTIEMVPLGSTWIVNSFPEYGMLNAGYLLRDASHLCTLWRSEVGDEIRQKVSDELGFQVLSALATGTRQVGLRKKKAVNTPADLAGLKMRMIGSKSYQFLGQALGANPTPMAFGEVYLALQTGTIDAQDNPLPTAYGAKFTEVMEQIVLTGHLVQDVLIGASNEFWDKLSEPQKEIVSEAAWVAADFATKAALRDERTLQSKLVEEGLAVTTPDVDAFRAHVSAAYEGSEIAQDWKPGMWEQIAGLETAPGCSY